jgi:hypothetical protein
MPHSDGQWWFLSALSVVFTDSSLMSGNFSFKQV